jgi:predicted phosphodiesterase
MITKNAEGEAEVHKLRADRYVVEPDAEEYSFVSQAAPTIIQPTERTISPSRHDKLTVALGDAQIGYRGDEAFHDESVIHLAHTAIRELQPDNIVLTGDMLDLPAFSSFSQRADWVDTTQRSIDRYHTFLSQLRADAPNANIVAVHGNHEKRMDSMVRRDAAPLLGIRRANAAKELSVLTIPYLCRYEELEVEAVTGYPNGTYWLEDNIKVIHGTVAKKGGQTASAYLRQSTGESIVFGHDHRQQLAYRTIAQRAGHATVAAASPGCLCRVDGQVPSPFYSVDDWGETVPQAMDWQNGLLVIEHSETTHDIQPVHIQNNQMRLNSKVYES